MRCLSYDVRLASSADSAAILDLQEQNLPNSGGTLSVRHSREWFEKAIADMPVVVASHDGDLVGYVVSAPLTAVADMPIIQALISTHPGSPGAYIYGPICVAKEHRGRGVAQALFRKLRAELPGREGITFIRADNGISLRAHEKMGMREVGKFKLDDTDYVALAYQG